MALSGMEATYPLQVGSITKNTYCILQGRLCKLADIFIPKPNRHGPTKAYLIATDIITGKKLEDHISIGANIDIPVTSYTDYQLVNITRDGFVSLMTSDGTTKDDLKLPGGDLGREINSMFEQDRPVIVTVLSAMREEHIVAVKENHAE